MLYNKCCILFQLLDAALANPEQAQFLVREQIDQLRGFGGVSENICSISHAVRAEMNYMPIYELSSIMLQSSALICHSLIGAY